MIQLAQAAIAKRRGTLVDECWSPSVKKSADPPKWRATFPAVLIRHEMSRGRESA